MNYDVYTGLLKVFSLPVTEIDKVHFTYDNDHHSFNLLRRKYPIEAVAGDGNDLSKAVNLLRWVSGHIHHKGDSQGTAKLDSLSLLEYAYDKGAVCGINCVALAAVLSECLLAVGLAARQVFMLPCSPYDMDNHVVTQVYIREIGKWVMMDPTYNVYVTNHKGECLSLLMLRAHLANQESIFFSHEAQYNDDEWTVESAKGVATYYAKNSFFFQTHEISGFSVADIPGNRILSLCPQGYDPKQILLTNFEYRARKSGGNAAVREWAESVNQMEYTYCSSEDFEAIPKLTI